MILIDSSVWIDHFRSESPSLGTLDLAEVITHPFVIGELACGTLRHRRDVLHLLRWGLGRRARSADRQAGLTAVQTGTCHSAYPRGSRAQAIISCQRCSTSSRGTPLCSAIESV